MNDRLCQVSYRRFIAVSVSTLYTNSSIKSMLSKIQYQIFLPIAGFKVAMILASIGCSCDAVLGGKNAISTSPCESNDVIVPWVEQLSTYRITFRSGELTTYLLNHCSHLTKGTWVIQAFEFAWKSGLCSCAGFFSKHPAVQILPINEWLWVIA